ncbi:MAG: nitroreductase family protein [Pirellulales bacterium]|nr:nitroreductase family protein [Pirellulales bacterium]
MGLIFDVLGQPSVDPERCTRCGQCVAICPDEVLSIDGDVPKAGPGLMFGCIACGHCVSMCPTGAIQIEGRGMRADDAVELGPREARANADQLQALLLARRSIRRFTDQEVDRATVDRIIEMITTAPMGIPPHEVGLVVFHGREKVREFSRESCRSFGRAARFFNPVVLTLMRPFIGKTNHAIMRDFVKPLMAKLAEASEAGRDLFTYDAPVAILFHGSALGDPSDAHIAATYGMLAAESLGLGNCLLGTTAGLNHDKAFRQRHGIPRENKIGLCLILGHPAVRFRRGVRRRLASVTFAE